MTEPASQSRHVSADMLIAQLHIISTYAKIGDNDSICRSASPWQHLLLTADTSENEGRSESVAHQPCEEEEAQEKQ